MDQFLSVQKFAELMDIHPNTVRKAIHNGRLQAIRISEGEKAAYRIPRSEVQRLTLVDLKQTVWSFFKSKEEKE